MKKKRTERKRNPLCHSIEIPLCEYKKRRIEEGEEKNFNTEKKMGFEFWVGEKC